MIFGAAGQAASMAVLAGTTSRVSTSMGIAAVRSRNPRMTKLSLI